MNKKNRIHASGLLFIVILFAILAFVILTFRNQKIDLNAALFSLLAIGVIIVEYVLLNMFFKHMDRLFLVITDFLVILGLTVLYRIDPEYAYRQILMFGIGVFFMIFCMILMRRPNIFRSLSWPLMAISIALLLVLTVVGKELNGAKNWLVFGNYSFQPSEFIKVITVFVLAHWFSGAVRLKGMWPALLFALVISGFLVVQRDLGAAVLIVGLTLIVLYVATGSLKLLGLGASAGVIGAVASYYLFSHVRNRVAIWQDPWATYTTSGYQVAQGLMAIASGGWLGRGLTMGMPASIPACHTDYIFAVICEEFGIVFGVFVVAFYLLIVLRGAMIALKAPDRFTMLVAFGCTTLLTLQSFIIMGGVIKLIPLTGITLPFVSYGGSSMLASMMLVGILQGVAIQGGETLEQALRKEIV